MPFFFALGVGTGASWFYLENRPIIAVAIQPFVIMVDIGIYSFFTWLFWDDMRLQFQNRLKKLRGKVGFKWARASFPERADD